MTLAEGGGGTINQLLHVYDGSTRQQYAKHRHTLWSMIVQCHTELIHTAWVVYSMCMILCGITPQTQQ